VVDQPTKRCDVGSSRGRRPRVVLDTAVLVAAAYAPRSASRRLLDACLRGDVRAVVSRELWREYEHIVRRAVRRRDFGTDLRRLLEAAELVQPGATPRVVPDDPGDDMVVAAAVAGGADAIVTNDRHLLDLDPYGRLRVERPSDFVRRWLTD
jgi:putative PIN family toxin of toxin-antitoxin system